jgi:hypothetical protein
MVVQGVGLKWIFSSSSRSFGFGYAAVRLRVHQNKDLGKFKFNNTPVSQ